MDQTTSATRQGLSNSTIDPSNSAIKGKFVIVIRTGLACAARKVLTFEADLLIVLFQEAQRELRTGKSYKKRGVAARYANRLTVRHGTAYGLVHTGGYPRKDSFRLTGVGSWGQKAWRAYSNKEEGSLTAGHRIKEENRRLGIHTFILRLHSLRNNQKKGKRFEPVGWRSYAQILIGSRLFLTSIAIHLSLRVAPIDLQQGGNSRIPYVHVPAARMSILVYIATVINTLLFLLTKHSFFLRSSGTGTEMGAFSTLFTLVTGGFRGRPMWGTFWVWDARLTSVFISFLIYLGALCFQKLPVEPAPISIRAGPIDIPIIKSSVNWWNTSHQTGSISRSDTSIHVPMPIPILSNFANSPLSTRILFVLETRLPIPSFLESLLKEELEAREGIPKPSSLAESLCIHG
ncbi:ccmC [Dorcoceras hygrometricum]|uniref:CcmC n=1 Tax=Dorcoceras hygrometricum TaxID=472368 RepID=A0A2Z7BIT1_9LAMI|nr:ccmC [Dorcoceras hygrometricum]